VTDWVLRDRVMYLRSDGLWCAEVELPPLNGKRQKKSMTAGSKAEVLKMMAPYLGGKQ
jgi:hypothetical protein